MELLTLLLSVIAVGVAVWALVLVRARPVRSGSGSGDDAVAAVAPTDQPQELRAGLATALRHVSVVRYDAFADVSGRQSFTAAILDDNGDGIVITSLHARTESRTLLKGVTGAAGDGLSPEEQEAVAYANGTRTT